MPHIQRVSEIQKAVARGAQRIQTAKPKSESFELRVKVPEQRHALVDRPEVHLNENGLDGPTGKHLSCALEYPLLSAFHIHLQDVDGGYPALPAKMVNRIGLNFDRLAGIRLSAKKGIRNALCPDVEFSGCNPIGKSQLHRVELRITYRAAKILVRRRKRLKRP